MTTVELRCCDLVNPIGLDSTPWFSWYMDGESVGQYQTAYQVIIEQLTVGKAVVCICDTGKIYSDCCIGISCGELNLLPCTVYRWRVRQWDKDDHPLEWSNWSTFETGLMGNYKGQWIGMPEGWELRGKPDPLPAPMLRRTFHLSEKPSTGRIYMCGLGYSVLYVNGKRIGNEVLAPAIAQYDQTVYYNTFDVTDVLKAGENVIGVILGNGWYNSYTDDPWTFKQAPWRARPKLWLQGRFVFHDESVFEIVSDTNWKVSQGPVIADGLRHGEIYDARLEKTGWTEAGYDDKDFQKVQIKRTPGGLRKAQHFTPIRCVEIISAVAMQEVERGVWVYDFGKNISGFVSLCAKGYAGCELVFRYSERVLEDGNIDREKISAYTLSGEFQTDHYIMKGAELETWSPEFTYHGFRYIEVTGYPGEHTLDTFQAKVVHTDFEKTGDFRCSNELVNKIQAAAVQATLTNFHGMPTDCPHREKNGWTGDAWCSTEQLLTNFDPRTTYRKWMKDIRDGQRPDGHLPGLAPSASWGYNRTGISWGIALVMIPWYQYLYWGDTTILKDNYEAMKLYYQNTGLMENDGIVAVDGEEFFAFGDWFPPGANEARKCPVALTETASYYLMAKTLGKIAEVLEKPNDAKLFKKAERRIKDCFRKAFFTDDGTLLKKRCQTAFATVLYHALQNDEETQAFVQALMEEIEKAGDHFDVGFHGMKYLSVALIENDLIDLGYKMITQPDYPSFGHMIHNGATTLWEDWEGEMSQNHHAYSEVSNFFYQGLAGIRVDPAHPGFKEFFLKPGAPKDLEWVEAWHQCPYGRIESKWHRENGKMVYHCTVPANTKAHLTLFDGRQYQLTSGSYTFEVAEEI